MWFELRNRVTAAAAHAGDAAHAAVHDDLVVLAVVVIVIVMIVIMLVLTMATMIMMMIANAAVGRAR
jgi:hypothetical protein